MNRTTVEQIKERIPVEELIGQYVKLEKSGKSFKARCPFHNEKSASFFVSPDRGGYYCFGCNAKGDIFSFVEQFEGLDFRGALKVLAEKAGVKLTYDTKADGERDRLFQIMEDATTYFEGQFSKNKEVQEYITKRGITEETRKSFRIGWAPEGWQNLIDNLRKLKYPDALMERAGLIKKRDSGSGITLAGAAGFGTVPTFSEKNEGTVPKPKGVGEFDTVSVRDDRMDGGFYDRFRGRVMFPIFDSSGRTIAFTGRILPRLDDGKAAKYLNSPDMPLYDKSLVLYGLDRAKTEIRRLNYTILVEGQMDLVMSHQAGIKNTVASSGTALTDEAVSDSGTVSNLGIVRRLSPNVIIAFDSDAAGRKAAMRAAGIGLSLGMDVKIADLTGGPSTGSGQAKDPADLVLHDPEDWKKTLRDAKPIIEFELGNVLRDEPDPRKTPRALRERVFPFLARIESNMDKAHFVKMISDKANISETAVWDDLRVVEKGIKNPPASSNNQKIPHLSGATHFSKGDSTPEASLSKSTLEKGDGRRPGDFSRLDLVERRMFGLLHLLESSEAQKANEYREQIKVAAGATYDHRIKRIEPLLSDLIFEAESFYGADRDRWDEHIKELISNFEENIINEELILTMQELKAAEKAGDNTKVGELAHKCQELSYKKAHLAQKRHK